MCCPVKELTAENAFITALSQTVAIELFKTDGELSLKDKGLIVDLKLSWEEWCQYHETPVLPDEVRMTLNKEDVYILPAQSAVLQRDSAKRSLMIGQMTSEDWSQEGKPRYACSLMIGQMMPKDWKSEESYYYKFLLPKGKCSWIHEISSSNYTHCYNKDKYCQLELIEVSILEQKIHLYPFNTSTEEKYIVIELQFPSTYADAQKYQWIISLSLGLITSQVPLDFAFVSCSIKKDDSRKLIGYQRLRDTIKCPYRFFTSGFEWLENAIKKKPELNYVNLEGYKDLLDWIRPEDFSNIVSRLYYDEKMARGALLLLDAPSLPLDYQGTILSVALETLSSVGYTTLVDPKSWKKTKKEVLEIIRRDFGNNSPIIENLENKWSSINSPTNQDKLSRPFADVGYELSELEKRVIKERNKFLHGSLTLKGTVEEDASYQSFLCFELLKLCSILLFRRMEFKYPLLNNAVVYGVAEAVEDKEPIFILAE